MENEEIRRAVCFKCRKPGALTIVKRGCQFRCDCGYKTEVFPIVEGTFCIHLGMPSVRVRCPFCGLEHYHTVKPIPALRMSHCPSCGFDGKEGEKRRKYLKKYPRAYRGGSYYVRVKKKEVEN